jgi:hypothetical protein
MILGFAHIVFSAPEMESAIEYWLKKGWSLIERHDNVVSSREKWKYTCGDPTEHDIALLQGAPKIEILRHNVGMCKSKSRMKIYDGYISLEVVNIVNEVTFFVDALGFTAENNYELSLARAVRSWNLNIKLFQSCETLEDGMFNLAGLSCLAFMSNNLNEDQERLALNGARDITNIFEVVLGEKGIKVLLCRTPGGNLIELYEVPLTNG